MQSVWSKALVFTGSILGAFLLLAGAARLLMAVVRWLFPARWNYLWRQGFANLYRPNNQTLILVVTIGLGTTFIGTLYFVQRLLIERVSAVAGNSQGNMVLFDIQPDQRPAIDGLAKQNNIRVLQEMPVVTMRVTKIRGFTVEQAAADRPRREGGGRGRGFERGGRAGRGRSEMDAVAARAIRLGRRGWLCCCVTGGATSRGNETVCRRWAFGQEFEIRATYRDSLLTASETARRGQMGLSGPVAAGSGVALLRRGLCTQRDPGEGG